MYRVAKMIDIELMRDNLLKQMAEIKTKLGVIDEMEKMADKIPTDTKEQLESIEVNNDYSALTIVKACEAILTINPKKYFSAKELLQKINDSNVPISEKSGGTIISQTLARLKKRNIVVDRRQGRKKVYKLKKSIVKSVSSVEPI